MPVGLRKTLKKLLKKLGRVLFQNSFRSHIFFYYNSGTTVSVGVAPSRGDAVAILISWRQ